MKHKYYQYSFLFFVTVLLTSFFVVSEQFAQAATGTNQRINFQGKVVNTNGTNVTNGSYSFTFSVYTVASGGSNVWTETKTLTVTDGIFQTDLGDTTALPGSIDFNTDNIYLGINFNSDGEMTPRVRFDAVPQAFNAQKVAGLSVTNTTGTLTIPNGKTISFADAFTTAGAFPLTLTSTASTNVTLPTTGTLATLAGTETFTNKTIGSTGLVFSGATTDITTAANETLALIANGTGIVDVQDTFNADTISTDTGGVSIAAGQSYTGVGALSLVSGGAGGLTLDSASGRVSVATGDFLGLSIAGVTGAASGDIWYDSTANKYKINENGTTKILCNTTDAGCGVGSGAVTSSGGIISKTTASDYVNLSFGDAADTQLVIENTTNATLPTADAMKIDLTGNTTGIVTNGVDGLAIDMEVGNGTANTNSGVNVTMTPVNTPSGDEVINGININNITSSAATETALKVGAGWDVALNAGSGNIITSNQGIEFTESDTNPTCAAGDYKIYADTSEGRLKKCQNGVASDMDTLGLNAQYKVQSADQSVTNTTTLATDSDMAFTIGAGETWAFVYQILVTNNNSSTPDWKSAITAPSGVTCNVVMAGVESAGANFPQVQSTDCVTPTTLVDNTIVADLNIPFNVYYYGQVTAGGSSATVNFQFAENTAGAGTSVTVKKGSVMQAFKLGGADLAEIYYTKDADMRAGSLVALDSSLQAGVKKTQQAYDDTVMGVVSTRPGMVLGDTANAKNEGMPVFLALSGRVPVLVNTENGSIQAGDYLTASSTPGIAMRATKSGRVIGQALHDYDGKDTGSVLTFLNSSFSLGATGTSETGTLTENSQASLLKMVSSLSDAETSSIAPSEIFTDHIVAGLEVVTPKVTTHELAVDTITNSLTPNIAFQLSQDGSIVITDETDASRAVFDAAGNAQFSGTVTADTIKANHIEGLEIFTDKLGSLADYVAEQHQDIATKSLTANNAIIARLDINDAQVALDMSVEGMITTNGLEVHETAVFHGESVFEKLATFIGKTIFRDSVVFESAPIFSANTAGIAKISKNADSVDVVFDKAYDVAPVVQISMTVNEKDTQKSVIENNYTYFVTHRTEKGFTIMLNKEADESVNFSWIALAVSDSKSLKDTQEIKKEDVSQKDVPSKEPIVTPAIPATPSATNVSGAQNTVTVPIGDAIMHTPQVDALPTEQAAAVQLELPLTNNPALNVVSPKEEIKPIQP